MEKASILVGLAIGFCTFALVWACARHFTGLAAEHSSALAIGIIAGLVTGVGYIALESRLFDSFRRRGHR